MNGGAISWTSRRQDNISFPTSEAEFVAASQASQVVVYLRETLRDFGYLQTAATDFFEVNLACIAMDENPVRRNSLDTKIVADALTKSLPSLAFISHRKVMLVSLKFLDTRHPSIVHITIQGFRFVRTYCT